MLLPSSKVGHLGDGRELLEVRHLQRVQPRSTAHRVVNPHQSVMVRHQSGASWLTVLREMLSDSRTDQPTALKLKDPEV